MPFQRHRPAYSTTLKESPSPRMRLPPGQASRISRQIHRSTVVCSTVFSRKTTVASALYDPRVHRCLLYFGCLLPSDLRLTNGAAGFEQLLSKASSAMVNARCCNSSVAVSCKSTTRWLMYTCHTFVHSNLRMRHVHYLRVLLVC